VSSKIIPFNPTPMTSYYRSIVTIGLSRTISEINGDFRRKSPIFSILRVFTASAERGFPWNWVTAQGSEETNMII